MYLADRVCRLQFNDDEIEEFIAYHQPVSHRITRFWSISTCMGKEIEVDAVCDGTDILIPGIMEHIERTGVHSGDSISVYPAPTISDACKRNDRRVYQNVWQEHCMS